MSNDKRELLRQLTIDRGAEPTRRAKSAGALWTAALLGLAIVGAATWWFMRPGGVAAPITVDVVEIPSVLVAAAAGASSASDSVLDASGYVIARRQATVSAKVTGKVIEVFIEEGMAVQEGMVLARLDESIPRAQVALSESQAAAARAGLAEIRVQIERAELDLERTVGLAERKLASQSDLDRARLQVAELEARFARAEGEVAVATSALGVQQALLKDMEIRAPFAGVVIAKAAQPGEMISPISAGGGFTRTGICTIVDMASLEVEVDVNESYINRVFADQAVAVTLNAYQDWRIPGHVIAIIPTADRNKATVRVRIGFDERDPRILPDMGVKVAFMDAARTEASTAALAPAEAVAETASPLRLPLAAVLSKNVDPHVYAVIDNRLQRRRVRVGNTSGELVEVLDGLRGGELVVLASQQTADALKPGQAVTIANRQLQ